MKIPDKDFKLMDRFVEDFKGAVRDSFDEIQKKKSPDEIYYFTAELFLKNIKAFIEKSKPSIGGDLFILFTWNVYNHEMEKHFVKASNNKNPDFH